MTFSPRLARHHQAWSSPLVVHPSEDHHRPSRHPHQKRWVAFYVVYAPRFPAPHPFLNIFLIPSLLSKSLVATESKPSSSLTYMAAPPTSTLLLQRALRRQPEPSLKNVDLLEMFPCLTHFQVLSGLAPADPSISLSHACPPWVSTSATQIFFRSV